METLKNILLVSGSPGAGSKITRQLTFGPGTEIKVIEITLPEVTAFLSTGCCDVVLIDLAGIVEAGAIAVQEIKRLSDGVPLIVISNSEPAQSSQLLALLGADDHLVDGTLESKSLTNIISLVVKCRSIRRVLEDSEQRYHGLLDLSPQPVFVHDESEWVFVNSPACKLLGADKPDEVLGKPVSEYLESADAQAQPSIGTTSVHRPNVRFDQRTLIKTDGSRVDVLIASKRCIVDGSPAVQLVVHDLVDPPPRLGEWTRYNKLTNLPDRIQFLDRLAGAIARAQRAGQLASVLLINLDNFSGVNAILGQMGGDDVLRKIAERLNQMTRKTDTVAHLNGDEFALVLEGLRHQRGALVFAERLLDGLTRPVEVNGRHVVVTASIGITVYPFDAADVDALWRSADVAMFHAKDSGRNNFKFFCAGLDARTRRDELRRSKIEQRTARLTRREREVMELLVTGKANQTIAYLLGTSTPTIETHRARIMEKMEAQSLLDLVRMAIEHIPLPVSFPEPHALDA